MTVFVFRESQMSAGSTKQRFEETREFISIKIESPIIVTVLGKGQYSFKSATRSLEIDNALWAKIKAARVSGKAAAGSMSATDSASSVAGPSSSRKPRSEWTSFNARDLTVTDEDRGYDLNSFDVDMEVIVFFKELVIGGTIVSKSRRAETLTVVLDTHVPTKVVVTFRAVVPVDNEADVEQNE
jgi:hypothetical protein